MNHASERFWDLPSALLLALALTIASQRLVATDWTSDLGIAFLLTLTGVALGLPFGLSRFRRGTVFLLLLLYGLVLVPFIMAALLYPGLPWLERMASMGGRLAYAFSIIAAGLPLEDAFLFLVIFAAGFWAIGAGSAYALTRRADFTGAVLPGGAALLLLQSFDARGDQALVFMALYIFLALILLGRMNYARRRETWRTWRVFAAGEAKANINLTILAVAFLLVITAWLMPVSSRSVPLLRDWWQSLSNLWRDNESLTNVVAGLETEEEAPVNNFYGRNLVLGQDAPTNNAVYFRIQTYGTSKQERFYWRVRSYNLYLNGLWESSTLYVRGFSSSTRSLQLPEEVGLSSRFRVKVVDTVAGSLVTPANPIWVSRSSRLTFFSVGDDAVEPVLFQANNPVRSGEEYNVHAILIEPTVKQLRDAGTEYPDWVNEYYLQLPPDLSPSIIDLAVEITAGAETPYDKAAAITSYLRNEISYTTHMPLPPAGSDKLTWFLFVYRQGFCNYYATAEVIMLRAVGIPARMVVGFSQGEYQSPGWYTVHQRNSHAWPEVYFPDIGWVEFEPTASEAELVRPLGEEIPSLSGTSVPLTPQAGGPLDLPLEGDGESPTGGVGNSGANRQNSLVILLVFIAAMTLLGGGLAWAYISGTLDKGHRLLRKTFYAPAPILARNWLEKNALPIPIWLEHLAWRAGLSPVARAFMSIYHALRALKIPASPALTPTEAAAALSISLPQAGEEIATLLAEYQPAFYYTTSASLERARLAAQSLRRKTRRARRDGWPLRRKKDRLDRQ
jgi:hypothetical protein